MSKLKPVLDALFNSPYLDKADVAAVISSFVILFGLHLSSAQQGASVLLIGTAYIVARKIEGALTK